MTLGATPASICNQALEQISAQATITGTNPSFDGTAAGNAAGILYTPAVNLLLRQQDYEFSRADGALVPSGAAVPFPWGFAYTYAADCMRVRQVYPSTWVANDPQPMRWTVQTIAIGGVQKDCILTSAAANSLCYSTNLVSEAQFDAVFQETLVRFLASEFAMALAGRPDFSAKILEQAGAMVGQGAGRDS
jgi:hypothetical protein